MCICPYFIHNRIWRRLLCLCFDIESTFSLWSHFFCLVSNSFPNKPGKNGWEDETKKVLRQTVLILYYVLLLVRREPRISCCCCWYLLLYMLWFNQYFALQTIVLSSDSDLSLYMLGVSESLFLVPHKKNRFLKAINEGKNLNFWLLLHMPRPISSSILSISTVCVYNNWLFWGVTLLIQPGGILTDSFWIFFSWNNSSVFFSLFWIFSNVNDSYRIPSFQKKFIRSLMSFTPPTFNGAVYLVGKQIHNHPEVLLPNFCTSPFVFILKIVLICSKKFLRPTIPNVRSMNRSRDFGNLWKWCGTRWLDNRAFPSGELRKEIMNGVQAQKQKINLRWTLPSRPSLSAMVLGSINSGRRPLNQLVHLCSNDCDCGR